MKLLHLFLFLLAACVATPNALATTQIQTPALEDKTHHNGPEDLKAAFPDDGKTNNTGKDKREERLNSVVSKIKGILPKKGTGLSTKLDTMRKNPDVVAALERNPTVKRIGDAIENDPKFITNLKNNPEAAKALANNPEFKKAATALENTDVTVTKKDISRLRSAVSTGESTYSRVGGLILGAATVGMPIVSLVLLIIAIQRRHT
ncbi:Avr1b-1 avirulence-like protein [Phytophthora sojae]|uniref:Avr1b-1 avirulence-like protein n=2 Tax=Phytophthora sojae TaxID=67593 RepID=G5A9E5_PHYSP|nr:Avr1b-1 avirulence-like protein [Phytophthora sojae]AEK80714.1 Avh128 [Phytophthora sojae]AEK80715.1 Avh128 [Phytophthora sojae]AEK80716.1 Avh128 [Phytophthora sojae]EGZ08520.1 Avr1b-1 avirulence-like protein [Phytophthora sojae]|eukprot:XP_009536692.1 Avr1b-1 avirulence-like protein [Phytophthora sojae]